MEPERLVRCLAFRFVMDALTPTEATAILRKGREGAACARPGCANAAIPPTRPVLVGRLLRGKDAQARHGGSCAGLLPQSNRRSAATLQKTSGEGRPQPARLCGTFPTNSARVMIASILPDAIGPDRLLMMDANQDWEVDEAITSMRQLAEFNPYWIEEPTSPDEILGCARIRETIRPILVAAGEHCQKRIMFKQMLQARAIDVCQLDVARLGGLNEAVLVLMAEKFGISICPHGGGVGLCKYIQHVPMSTICEHQARLRAASSSMSLTCTSISRTQSR